MDRIDGKAVIVSKSTWVACMVTAISLCCACDDYRGRRPEDLPDRGHQAILVEQDRFKMEAERWLLQEHASPEDRIIADTVGAKYYDAYQAIATPGYKFLTTDDPELQTRILVGAIRSCHPKDLVDLLHWARDPRRGVRSVAHMMIYELAHGGGDTSDSLYRHMLSYLRSDLPAQYLAEALSAMPFVFGGRNIPESVLRPLEVKGREESGAGRYIRKALELIRSRGGRVPAYYELGSYSPFEGEVSDKSAREVEVNGPEE